MPLTKPTKGDKEKNKVKKHIEFFLKNKINK
jgi:hypothetical protein